MKLTHEILFSEKESADIKELQNAGYLDSGLELTQVGENVLLRLFVFNQYKTKLIERARAKNAETQNE